MSTTEKQLVFEDIFKQHFHQLYVRAYAWVQEEENAKDIVQDAYCHLWENFEYYRPNSNYLSLLYTFVRSRSLDWLRHQQTVNTYITQQQAVADEEVAHDYDDYDERIARMMQAIRKFPPQMRRVFVLCTLHHKTYKETGELLGISPLTVKTLMARAFKILRTQKEFFSPILVLLFSLPSVL